MHKKYTYKDGKKFGPYYYETKRVNGRVVTTYLGSNYSVKRRKDNNFSSLTFLFSLLIVFLILFLLFYGFNLTGNASLELDDEYIEGELIGGTFKIILREGELIPKDSSIKVRYGDFAESFVLSDLLGEDGYSLVEGKFYAENSDLKGEGEGYGLRGKRVSYPELDFELEIEKTDKNNEENKENKELENNTGVEQQGINEQEIIMEESGIAEEVTTENERNVESDIGDSVNEESVENTGSVITGEVINEQKDGGNKRFISGKVSRERDFEYSLGEGESARLVEGSVKIASGNKENLDDSKIEINIKKNKVIITSNYEIEEEGFGKDFLGDERAVLKVDLNKFGIVADSNNARLEIDVSAQDDNIVSISGKVNVKAKEKTEAEGEKIDGEISLMNESLVEKTQILINNTKVNLTQHKAVIGQPVKWEKKINVGSVNEDLILRVNIPESAENISVIRIKTEAVDLNKEVNETEEINNDQGLKEEIQENQSIIGVSITGEVSAEINTNVNGERFGLIDWFKDVFSRFSITGRVSQSIGEKVQEIDIDVSVDDEEIVVEYYTDAPQALEIESERGKTIMVTSPDDVHYEDVLVYTGLSEAFGIKDSGRVKIYWQENESYIEPSLIEDRDENGLYDYIEWIAPHLSNQTFEIIVITRAEHLNSTREFVSDIFESVRELDGNWSETIADGEYIRVRFERNLTSVNDISIYPRIVEGNESILIEVYEIDENATIARFENLINNSYNKVYLSDLIGSQDSFDLRVIGGSIELDHVIDPTPILAAGTREGMLVYVHNSTRSLPQYRMWNGSTWSGNYSALDVGGNIVRSVIQASPTRQEYIIGTDDGSNDVNIQINSTISAGSCWHNGTACNNVLEVTTNNAGGDNRPGFDIAYEQGGGSEAVVVYTVTNQNNASYRIWNGTSWTADTQVPQNRLIGSHINYIRMASHPYTDEIALLMANTTETMSVIIWNGTAWGCEPSGAISIGGAANQLFADLVYEQQSGDLFIANTLSTTEIDYTVKLNNSCDYTTTQTTNLIENGEEISLQAQYGSDYVMISQRDNTGNDMEAIVWNGTAMLALSGNELDLYNEKDGNEIISATWAGTSSEGFVIYSDNALSLTLDYFQYNKTSNTWNDGSATGLHTTGAGGITNFTDEEVNIVSYSFIDENKTWVFVRDDEDDLWVKLWNGSGFQDSDGGVAFDTNVAGQQAFPVIDFTWKLNYSAATDTTAPIVSITYPNPTSYFIDITGLNYTVSDDVALSACWYSLNNGLTNTTITCGNNVTGLSSGDGVITWYVYANDTSGNIGSHSTGFTVNAVPVVNLIHPANNTGASTNASYFAVNVSDNVNVSNATLYIWNSTTQIGTNSTDIGIKNAVANLSFTLPRTGTYRWNYFVIDNSSNKAMNATNWTFIFSLSPNDPAPSINATLGINRTLEDLNCFDTIKDPETDRMNVSVRWYNNSVLHLAADFNNSYVNGTFFNAVLDDGNTTKGHNWTCSLRLFDGISYSNWVNSTFNVSIRNTPPNSPALSSPADHNTTTDRTPDFSWSSHGDDDGDSLTYQLNLTCIHSAGGGCSAYGSDDRLITGISGASHTIASDLLYLSDNLYYYNWTVRAHDGDESGNYNNSARRINISSLIAVSLLNSSISFGNIYHTASNDTSDNSPLPFLIQNDGNSFLNITIGASSLWRTAENPTSNYQFKANNYSFENNSFSYSLSVLSYTNVPASGSPAICIARLNYTDLSDSAEIDINVTVPSSNEGSGVRNSTVTFTASLGE